MVAVGIMAVLLSIAIPKLYTDMHKDSMRKAVTDVMELCASARAQAILDGTTTELRIRPAEGAFSVGGASARSAEDAGTGRYMLDAKHTGGGTSSGERGASSVKLSPSIRVEGLGVNGEDWTEDEEARVRFYANGTCEEMSIVLLSDRGERRNIYLEVVTGMAEYEVDPVKFKAR
jgi:Tfp pilus assembly protein FimT